ncbi:MAG: VWA domain-containing protein [Planctomycetota bacterium]
MIERLLGIDPESTLTGWSLHFRADWPLRILALLVLAVATAATFYYWRESVLSRLGRLTLAIVRAAAVSLLLAMLFRPVLQAQFTTTVRPSVLVLVDESDSMNIRDTRKDVVSLAEAGTALGKLPYPSMDLPRAVRKAIAAMRHAATVLDAGLLDEARDGQEQIAAALGEIHAGVPERSQGGEDFSAGLKGIEGKQVKLRRDLEAGDSVGACPAQREIIAELIEWKDRVGAAGLAINDKLKAELALVSRKELVDEVLQHTARPMLDELGRRETVRYFHFARELRASTEFGNASPATPASGEHDGSATWLGSAIDEAVEQSGNTPNSTVVILTDGASNGGADPTDAAWRLRRRGIRLVTVGVGLPEPDDTSIRNLIVPDVVFANDIVPLRVQCSASGYEKRSTTLLVKLDGAEVARKTVTFSGQSRLEELPFKAGRGGIKTLEVELVPLPGEATTKNNALRRSLRVLDEKIKVLYIEGTPRWEYRYIRAVLKRDPRIDVQFINTEGDKDLARASKEHLGRFPEKEAQAFRYDLVILGDVRANTFTPTQLSLMEQLVRERGGSLILLAGPKHAPAEYLDTPIAAMLPVRFEQEKWEEIGDDVYPVLTPEGRRSTVMALERAEARTQALWSNVKPLNWVPPLLAPKPGAQVLAELSDTAQRTHGFPLIAWQRYGAGKCMFVGTDQLWRLRARTSDKYHLKFWGQAIQFLTLSRLLGDNQRLRLQTGQEEYALGEPVEMFANVLSDLYEPRTTPAFTVHVAPSSGGEPQSVALRAMPGQLGMYQGFFTPTVPGRYRLSASAEDEAPTSAGATPPSRVLGAGLPAAVEFDVRPVTAEQIDTSMHRDMLTRAAEITGGEYLSLRELPLLPDTIQGQPQVATFTKDVELWDNWLVPLVFVGFVALEWGWRRKRNLA